MSNNIIDFWNWRLRHDPEATRKAIVPAMREYNRRRREGPIYLTSAPHNMTMRSFGPPRLVIDNEEGK